MIVGGGSVIETMLTCLAYSEYRPQALEVFRVASGSNARRTANHACKLAPLPLS